MIRMGLCFFFVSFSKPYLTLEAVFRVTDWLPTFFAKSFYLGFYVQQTSKLFMEFET